MREDSESFHVTDEVRRVENLFHHTKRNFLVLGSAGTGKSLLLKRLVQNSRKHVQVLAFTGLAAFQVGGQTVHRFFGFELGLQRRSHLRFSGTKEQAESRRRLFSDIGAILIDEVSMLRVDLLDAIQAVLQEHGPRPGEPFGGVQIGLFGDVLQLPPIVKNDEQQAFRSCATAPGKPLWDEGWISPWFFDSFAFKLGGFIRVTLTRIFRQQAEAADASDFLRALQRLREGRLQPEDFDMINARVTEHQPDRSLSLVTTNHAAEELNSSCFNALPGRAMAYHASRSENWPRHWKGDEPVPDTVQVKKEALVLVCANGAGPGLVNGSVGTVIGFDDDQVVLRVRGQELPVKRYVWRFPIWRWDGEKMVRDGETTYAQMPLKLAWAMTIHKAQGQTIDGPMWVDLGQRVWSGGQAYVALSRVRQIAQLHLRRALEREDALVERTAWQFLTGGDSGSCLEETRALALTVYRTTKRLKNQASEERERVEELITRGEALFVAATNLLQECKENQVAVINAEERIMAALDNARKRNWLKRWLCF